MASGEVVLGRLLPLVEVNTNNQDYQEITEDDNVIGKGEAESCHRKSTPPKHEIFRVLAKIRTIRAV